MKIGSLRYLLKEGFQNLWHNRYMGFASIGVLLACLVLIGGSYLLFANVNNAFNSLYEQNVVVAFAKQNATAEEVQKLNDQLKSIANVRHVEYQSKDDILQKYADSFSEDLFTELQGENNPMQDAFIVTFADLAKFDATLYQIENLDLVDGVSSSGNIAKTLTELRSAVLIAGGWVIVLLLVVSLFIIANTIKLTVYNRRLEIGIMKSVGATNSFIRIPFVVEGMALGLLAGGLAFGITYFVYSRLATMFTFGTFTGLIPFASQVWTLLGGYLGIGSATGALGSILSMNRYLKDEGRSAFE